GRPGQSEGQLEEDGVTPVRRVRDECPGQVVLREGRAARVVRSQSPGDLDELIDLPGPQEGLGELDAAVGAVGVGADRLAEGRKGFVVPAGGQGGEAELLPCRVAARIET